MDGLLVIDKPAGPTSHDVVARLRRVLRERRIGHTGTLDPAATGVLPLVVGRATRLARFLTAGDKVYDAVVRLGQRTDTGDAAGEPIGAAYDGPLPSRAAIEAALDGFRGTFLQQPPAFSAKKIDGDRSHRLARARRRKRPADDGAETAAVTALPAPVRVTMHALDLVSMDGDRVSLRVHCSAGFYVRSLAHDLGERLGAGAHLAALRRTRSGGCSLADAIGLDDAERDPAAAAQRLVPLGRILPDVSAVVLTSEGVRHAAHGRDLGPADVVRGMASGSLVRLLDGSGDLVGLAEPARTPGLLHPSVVLV